jgi:hypothetical protein
MSIVLVMMPAFASIYPPAKKTLDCVETAPGKHRASVKCVTDHWPKQIFVIPMMNVKMVEYVFIKVKFSGKLFQT